MSTTLKWILGILAALVIIAVIAGGIYLLSARASFAMANRLNRFAPAPGATPGAPQTQPYAQPNQPGQPNQPFGFRPFRTPGYGPGYGYERHMPMMGGRGFGSFRLMPFGFGMLFLGGLLRLLIPLVILVLVAILFYQLGKHSRPAPAPASSQAQPPSAPTDLPAPPPGRKVAKN